MTRQRSDRARNAPVERPEPLGRPPATTVAVTANHSPLLGYVALSDGNYPPLTDAADHRAILREERFRVCELADLPDTCEEDLL